MTAGAYRPAWRGWLAAWTWLCLGLLLAGNAQAQGFDRAAELQRYRAWMQHFTQDLDTLAATRAALTGPQLDALFARSVVPGSRASAFIRQAFTRPAGDHAYLPVHGAQNVVVAVLNSAIPAGEGGLYPETEPDLQGQDLTVWYLHVDVGNMTNTYLESSGNFTPYRLPPAGKLERNAFPFVLMDTRGDTLRLGGVSRELAGLMAYLQHAAAY
ncbi:hypothetical protein LMG3458_00049 [Achromobacter deleyi]|uniref:Uncharacterized protein n=1 Tax=Achromobacter deleyi TaxID=1353891 RepID=A0A6S6Z4A6_9BURK|nr:hypothetical protein [Achromobacter deleyi]CAB3650695.1 hypothetical protein LMG3458_00049 [Achromobacter deleyi]CAB3818188.1 hypothetical protein LMG3481_00112 [Achromobacter deleyi]CAB3823829.1 hypothetical protein LMG3482_00405 [Achromobacter deleyi]